LAVSSLGRRVGSHLSFRPDTSEPFGGSTPRNAPYLLVAALLVLLHLGSSPLGYMLVGGGSQVVPVFPEAALDLVAVLLFGRRYWPVLLIAYFASGLERSVPWLPSAGMAVGALARS